MILITGVTGYIGSHLAIFFDKQKIDYIGIDNLSYSYKSNIQNKKKIYNIDISNTQRLSKLFKKFKITKIIHAAAFSYVMEGEKYKKKYYNNNIIKTKKFINFCIKRKIEDFMFLSSSNVYEEKKYSKGFREINNLKPKNFYGQNKLEIEKFLIKKKFKKLLILRLFNIIGIFNKNFKIFKFKKKNYQRLIFKLIQNINKKKVTNINYTIYNNKKIFPSRDFIDIKDLVRIIFFLIKNSNYYKNRIKILNIGTGRKISVSKIIILMKIQFKKKLRLNFIKMSNKELISTKANIQNLKKIINFKIKLNLIKTLNSNFNL